MVPTNIVEQLIRDEGCVLRAYRDSRGILTAGVGHNLEAHPDPDEYWFEGKVITQEKADAWLAEDIRCAQMALQRSLPWTFDIGEIRRAVFVNMCFNLGIAKLLGFHTTLSLAKAGDYVGASKSMLASLWAAQVGLRATRLSIQLAENRWQ